MSVDAVFQPKGPTVQVGTSAVQVVPPGTGPAGMVSFRIANNILSTPAATRIGWGDTAAKASAAAPTGTGANSANSINIAAGAVITLELPATIWLIASTAASLEVTPGQGTANS